MDLDMQVKSPMVSLESMELLSQAWCSSAIQVYESAAYEDSMVSKSKLNPVMNCDKNSKVDDDTNKPTQQWKFDDLKSWIWLQQAIHPELDYNLCLKKKWFSRKIMPWNHISIKEWIKEIKQKRKEEQRLHKAEIYAAVSVAGIAAALAAIAAENIEPSKPNTSKETAVASAAALIAAKCAQVAEAAGAKREQVTSAITLAMASTDASSIITLTAAAATSLKGATVLRGRTQYKVQEKESKPTLLHDEFEFNFKRFKTDLAKGDVLLMGTPGGGKSKFRSVSVILNNEAKVILRIKKTNILMSFSGAKECTIYNLHAGPQKEPNQGGGSLLSIDMTTNQGKIQLNFEEYRQYKTWIMTINHMLLALS